jgi:hypothetical protein
MTVQKKQNPNLTTANLLYSMLLKLALSTFQMGNIPFVLTFENLCPWIIHFHLFNIKHKRIKW